jgi:para-aminobenzoate synthetase component 2
VILVIDNYDSFTFNLVQAFEVSGALLRVVRNDRIDRPALEALARGEPRAGDGDGGPRQALAGIVISPGPGDPTSAGISLDAVHVAAAHGIPLLGVCLGLQCLGAAFGAAIVEAPTLVHGEASDIFHDGSGLLAGLPSPFPAARYHSLAVAAATVPPIFEITGRTADGVIMAMRHRDLPLEGVQFHPESVLTPAGPHILANFLRRVGEGRAEILDAAAEANFATRGLATAGTGR